MLFFLLGPTVEFYFLLGKLHVIRNFALQLGLSSRTFLFNVNLESSFMTRYSWQKQ